MTFMIILHVRMFIFLNILIKCQINQLSCATIFISLLFYQISNKNKQEICYRLKKNIKKKIIFVLSTIHMWTVASIHVQLLPLRHLSYSQVLKFHLLIYCHHLPTSWVMLALCIASTHSFPFFCKNLHEMITSRKICSWILSWSQKNLRW